MKHEEEGIQLTPEGLASVRQRNDRYDAVSPEEHPELFPGRDEKAQLQDAHVPIEFVRGLVQPAARHE